MEHTVLGWADDGPTLRLDHERFSYAGKFVMSSTGKAVAREDGSVVAAAAFDADRTAPDSLRIRYITVRADRRGEGIGPRLLRFVADRALEAGYERVCIAVNNPFAYEASYRAGFGFTGETTGIAEVVCAYPATDADRGRYQDGLDVYRDRDLSTTEEDFLARHRNESQPPTVESP